jgi:lysophospholipase L1-like esterase
MVTIGFPPFIFLLFFIAKPTKLKIRKKKYEITSLKKLVVFIILICLILIPGELYLRNKYRDVEQHTYRYTVDNFHPFLQFIPSKAQNLHINQWGFRGDEITKQKSKNTYRVFLLGGSTVFNSGVIYEKNVSKRLEEMLSQKYPEKKIEVINAGVDGYTSEHSLIQYLFYIKDFSPDMIIMWHGINDWYYSCTPKQYAYTSYKSDYSHHLGADAQMVFAHFQPSPLLSFHSVLVDQIGIFLKDNLYSDITTKIKQAAPFPGIYSKKSLHKTYKMTSYSSLPSYKRNLQSFITAIKNDQVTLLLGNQPYLYKKNISDTEQKVLLFPVVNCMKADGSYPSLESMILAMEAYNKTIEEKAQENSIPFINLEKALPKTLKYFTDDVHYTEKGNAVVANKLYESIIKGAYIQ